MPPRRPTVRVAVPAPPRTMAFPRSFLVLTETRVFPAIMSLRTFHAGLADIEAKLEKLSVDPRCSPQRIGDAHLADKLAYFYRHGRSSAAVLRFPSPIRSKSRAMPTNYGLRSDDCKCGIHLGKPSADASQYQPVNRNKSKSLRISASQHIDLLP